MTSGQKTPEPVSYEKAKKAFDSLVNSKTSKGYRFVDTEKSNSPSFTSAPSDKIDSGFRPQLLNAIDQKRAQQLLADDDWVMQVKKDGRRLTIEKTGDTVIGINRKGQVIPLRQDVVDEVLKVPRDMRLDGEMVEKFYVFDLLGYGPPATFDNIQKLPYIDRFAGLCKMGMASSWDVIGLPNGKNSPIQVVPVYSGTEEKTAAFEVFKAIREEGVVFKKKDSLYSPGRPDSGGAQLKFKWTQMCTAKVLTTNSTKRSVQLGLIDDDKITGIGQPQPLKYVGNCGIPANYDIPNESALCEIRYLYAYPDGGRLYQPFYLGERPDKDEPDKYSSLKFKQTIDEDDEA